MMGQSESRSSGAKIAGDGMIVRWLWVFLGVINRLQRSAFECDPFVGEWNIRSVNKIACICRIRKLWRQLPRRAKRVGVGTSQQVASFYPE